MDGQRPESALSFSRSLAAAGIRRYLTGLLLLWLLTFPLAVEAQEPTDKEAQLVIPPNPDGPTEVYVDLIIRNITGINERDEVFEIDAELLAEWTDERLAFDSEQFGAEEKVYQGDVALEKLKTEIWWPDLEIADSRGPRDRLAVELRVYEDGYVAYAERFRTLVYQPFDLRDFPFDNQTLSLDIRPFSQTVDRVILVEPEETKFKLDWETDEWQILDEHITIEPGSLEDEEVGAYDTALVEITISRIPSFYISNFVLPLLLIVAISWAVFWMDFESMHLADRLSVSFTSVLTIVAFDFVMSDSLPKLAYPTLIDRMMTVSYIFLGLTVLENVVGYMMIRKGKPDMAQRIDSFARWLFPLAYVVMLAIAAVIGLSGG